jgi:hypothetical protein
MQVLVVEGADTEGRGARSRVGCRHLDIVVIAVCRSLWIIDRYIG